MSIPPYFILLNYLFLYYILVLRWYIPRTINSANIAIDKPALTFSILYIDFYREAKLLASIRILNCWNLLVRLHIFL